jgi:hypothetical protein
MEDQLRVSILYILISLEKQNSIGFRTIEKHVNKIKPTENNSNIIKPVTVKSEKILIPSNCKRNSLESNSETKSEASFRIDHNANLTFKKSDLESNKKSLEKEAEPTNVNNNNINNVGGIVTQVTSTFLIDFQLTKENDIYIQSNYPNQSQSRSETSIQLSALKEDRTHIHGTDEKMNNSFFTVAGGNESINIGHMLNSSFIAKNEAVRDNENLESAFSKKEIENKIGSKINHFTVKTEKIHKEINPSKKLNLEEGNNNVINNFNNINNNVPNNKFSSSKEVLVNQSSKKTNSSMSLPKLSNLNSSSLLNNLNNDKGLPVYSLLQPATKLLGNQKNQTIMNTSTIESNNINNIENIKNPIPMEINTNNHNESVREPREKIKVETAKKQDTFSDPSNITNNNIKDNRNIVSNLQNNMNNLVATTSINIEINIPRNTNNLNTENNKEINPSTNNNLNTNTTNNEIINKLITTNNQLNSSNKALETTFVNPFLIMKKDALNTNLEITNNNNINSNENNELITNNNLTTAINNNNNNNNTSMSDSARMTQQSIQSSAPIPNLNSNFNQPNSNFEMSNRGAPVNTYNNINNNNLNMGFGFINRNHSSISMNNSINTNNNNNFSINSNNSFFRTSTSNINHNNENRERNINLTNNPFVVINKEATVKNVFQNNINNTHTNLNNNFPTTTTNNNLPINTNPFINNNTTTHINQNSIQNQNTGFHYQFPVFNSTNHSINNNTHNSSMEIDTTTNINRNNNFNHNNNFNQNNTNNNNFVMNHNVDFNNNTNLNHVNNSNMTLLPAFTRQNDFGFNNHSNNTNNSFIPHNNPTTHNQLNQNPIPINNNNNYESVIYNTSNPFLRNTNTQDNFIPPESNTNINMNANTNALNPNPFGSNSNITANITNNINNINHIPLNQNNPNVFLQPAFNSNNNNDRRPENNNDSLFAERPIEGRKYLKVQRNNK